MTNPRFNRVLFRERRHESLRRTNRKNRTDGGLCSMICKAPQQLLPQIFRQNHQRSSAGHFQSAIGRLSIIGTANADRGALLFPLGQYSLKSKSSAHTLSTRGFRRRNQIIDSRLQRKKIQTRHLKSGIDALPKRDEGGLSSCV